MADTRLISLCNLRYCLIIRPSVKGKNVAPSEDKMTLREIEIVFFKILMTTLIILICLGGCGNNEGEKQLPTDV